MKRINTLKGLVVAALLGASASAEAQIHAVAYGPHTLGGGTTLTKSNWYKDYVGVRLAATAPTGSPIIGEKQYTTANDGSGGSGVWGTVVTAPIINVDIVIPTDSLCTGPLATGSMTGKIGVVYRGGGIEFGDKAKKCQTAGAIACVIINNQPGGPVGMGAGAVGSTVGIPVFMISKLDGDAIDAQYRGGGSTGVKMSITPWGQNLTNDLGFIGGGLSSFHNYAIPKDQLTGSGSPTAYKQVDGAFIANFGSSTMPNIVLNSKLEFSAGGTGTPSTVHTSSVALTSFPATDSIWAMFDTLSSATNVYDVTTSGTGRFDLTYTLSSTTTDDYAGDNTATTSFWVTDSVYCKGRYDMTNNYPYTSLYEGRTDGASFMFGPMYFVKNGGAAISRLQYSLSNGSATSSSLDAGSNDCYIFKWVDGSTDRGFSPADGILQNGELILVGKGTKSYTAGVDTSGAKLNMTIINIDSVNTASNTRIVLENNMWYYIGMEIPAGYYMGCDGASNLYPRVFGMFNSHTSNANLEYQDLFTDTKDNLWADWTGNNGAMPFTQTMFIGSVDSFNYSQTKGIVPQVAMIVENGYTPPPPVDHSGVNNVNRPMIGATVSPNPASNYVNVSVDLSKKADKVTYTIIDGLARLVSKEVHTNVLNETYHVNTANLAAGHYYVVIDADGNSIYKKFVIVK